MEIILDTAIIEQLSSNGVLAYIAVKIADGTQATTAALASLVRCKTGNMLDGIKELAVAAPELVSKVPKSTKWRCGVVKAGDGVVLQNLESERYLVFVDDLKKYWEFMNPSLPFEMGGKDGAQIRRFLSDHRQWLQADWRTALQHRKESVRLGHATRSQPLWTWVGRLDEYSAGPLDRWNKPVGNGGGKHGEAASVRDRNREAVAAAVAHS